MASRLELHGLLLDLLGSCHVYYQPPETVKMVYPAIRYAKSNIRNTYANNVTYLRANRYELTVIDTIPDNPVIDKLLDQPYCFFDRHYTSDNLDHTVLTIYY